MIQPANSTAPYRQQIDQAVDALNQLRPFPATATRLMEVCRQEDANVKDVIRLIECEPTVASKVLSLSNSPLYGTTRPISTIGHAVVILGFQTVSKVAVSIATGQVFSSGCPATEFYRKLVFNQSIGSATASRVFANRQDACPDEAFLVGIMQDIGQLVFLDVLSEEYLDFVQQHTVQEGLVELEQQAFGTNHAAVGERCGWNWGLPTPINTAIGRHHDRLSNAEHPLSRTTIIGSYFARKWNLGFEPLEHPLCQEIETAFDAGELEQLESACREAFQAVNEICAL